MHLLYCLNSIVVAVHDDDDPFVDPSAYGTGVRVIPWNQPLSDLPLSGPAPTDPEMIPPPYLQPAETPAILLAYAAQSRYLKSTTAQSFTPTTGPPFTVNAQRQDQSLINNLATYAQSVAGTTAINFTQNNASYAITATDAINMFNQLMAHGQACRNAEATCITDLTSATPTILTYADVDAKFAGV